MSAAWTPEQIARAAFRLAEYQRQAEIAGEDTGLTREQAFKYFDEVGDEDLAVLMFRVRAQMGLEELAAIERYRAIRNAQHRNGGLVE